MSVRIVANFAQFVKLAVFLSTLRLRPRIFQFQFAVRKKIADDA